MLFWCLFVFMEPIMPRTNEQIYHDVTRKIRQIEAQKVRAQQHFQPRYKGRNFILSCWCGIAFVSDCIERSDLERLISFINEHCECAPKEMKK